MEGKQSKARMAMPTRWDAADWAYLAQVAKSIGTNRSDFIRTAALNAARAISSLSSSYFVEGPKAPPQNTAINDFSNSTAKAGGGGKSLMGEPNRIRRGASNPAKPRRG